MKRWIAVVAVLGGSLVITAPAEAAKTSAKEGRKFSRGYMKDKIRDGDLPDYGWHQRDCWRIGPDGAGDYRIFPNGVVCLFSTTKEVRGTCGVYGVAVKDGRKRLQASNVSSIQAYRGDPADCDPQAFMDYPVDVLGRGVVGDPLRPGAAAKGQACERALVRMNEAHIKLQDARHRGDRQDIKKYKKKYKRAKKAVERECPTPPGA
jgi:hypothetical protein